MCGIAGILLHANRQPSRETLQFMSDLLRLRGPDGNGLFLSLHIGLVHLRLAIRDLSSSGQCPMGSRDQSIQLVFNGEIYNWREVRAELEQLGYIFQSQSDAEVILHGYQHWGEGIIPKLNGMFAIAIWDARSRCLLLARDRAGEKPLFFAELDEGLVFASTIEALQPIQSGRIIDQIAVAAYLAHTFIPSGHTIWRGTNVLAPATSLSIEVGGKLQIRRYWDFPRVPPGKRAAGYQKKAEAALEESVVRCLDADVPAGVFLSGGVDLSLVAAIAARHRPNIPAFSLGFADPKHSELDFARRVARHLKLAHSTIEIAAEDVLACLPHLVRQYGQPFGDASAVPTYFLSKFSRRHVKFCLSGDGGDECFGGYWRMKAGVYAARYAALLPHRIRADVIPKLAAQLGPACRRLQALNSLSLAAPGAGYTNSQSWFDHLSSIAGPRLKPALTADLSALRTGKAARRKEASIVQTLLYDDFQVQLPDAYLTKVDVASMAASLEVRAPFLEQRVVELAWELPDSMKLNWGHRKWLLKKIAARHLPREIVFRRKRGFSMPLSDWFRGELGETLENLLTGSVAIESGWVRRDAVLGFLHAHRSGEDHSTRLWLILWLEYWFRLIGNASTAKPEPAAPFEL